MTKEIGDPLERAATTGKLGGVSPAARATPPGPEKKTLEGGKSGMLEVQTSTTKETRKQQTVYLPPALAKWVKMQAIEEEREISEIVTDALEMYRKLYSA
jgi:hypothetical protein